MQREMLNFILKDSECLKGGTKEACIKVKDYLVDGYGSCISDEEFIESVKVLLAFAFLEEDIVPKRWKCDTECKMCSKLHCLGGYNVDISGEECPYCKK